MSMSDWNLEANEEENTPTYSFREFIIKHTNVFVDTGDDDPFYECAYETNAVIKLSKNADTRN